MSILFPVLTPYAGSFCAAAGEPLRGTTVTHERGGEVAYLIGATSHRASRLAVLVPLGLPRAQVDAALRASLNGALPGLGSAPDALEPMAHLLRFCASNGEAGDLLGVQVVQGRVKLTLTPFTVQSQRLVAGLEPGARGQLLTLLGTHDGHTTYPA
ncbi:hypothetical protein [Deinococcus radiotolerans]|uniref:Uncharacterized protein n=1 Tax=Deinococcus radiotolerans TaxID=1309407 RepID=A0ABQ2FQF8_9DEIO|nr:hypothetical protein [Deinococcus radiotolerans]GGL16780.1 hypothetical protein GCM10010844_39640 [Deinococcus radiotolerans]